MKLFFQGISVSVVVMVALVIMISDHAFELFMGWLLPSLAGIITMYFINLSSRQDSITLTKTIAKGFALKMIYYGIAILLLYKYSSFQPIPFICSFSGFFMGLHGLEAVIIKRISEKYITT